MIPNDGFLRVVTMGRNFLDRQLEALFAHPMCDVANTQEETADVLNGDSAATIDGGDVEFSDSGGVGRIRRKGECRDWNGRDYWE